MRIYDNGPEDIWSKDKAQETAYGVFALEGDPTHTSKRTIKYTPITAYNRKVDEYTEDELAVIFEAIRNYMHHEKTGPLFVKNLRGSITLWSESCQAPFPEDNNLISEITLLTMRDSEKTLGALVEVKYDFVNHYMNTHINDRLIEQNDFDIDDFVEGLTPDKLLAGCSEFIQTHVHVFKDVQW